MDAKMNKKQDIVKLAKAGNEPAEFALGKKGILICPEDDSYYFKKSLLPIKEIPLFLTSPIETLLSNL